MYEKSLLNLLKALYSTVFTSCREGKGEIIFSKREPIIKEKNSTTQ
jgi:hypothetical protein